MPFKSICVAISNILFFFMSDQQSVVVVVVCVCVCVCVRARARAHARTLLSCFSHAQLFVTQCTIAHRAPPIWSWGFSRQEYQSRLPCPPRGDLPDPGIEPMSSVSPALAVGYFTSSAAINIEVHVAFKIIIFVFFRYICRSIIAGSNGLFYFQLFLRKRLTVFHRSCTDLHYHQQHTKVPLTSHSLQDCFLCSFDDNFSDICELISQCGFDLQFPDDLQC